jgi:hypothetical protein
VFSSDADMETLERVYGTGTCIADHIAAVPPTPLVGVVSLGGASAPTVARVQDALQRVTTNMAARFEVITDVDANLPHAKSGHHAASIGTGGTASQGGRSDGTNQNASLSQAATESVRECGVLKSSWIQKHRHHVFGCYLVVEDLTQLSATDRLTVETNFSNRVDKVRHALKGRSNRLLVAVITDRPASASPNVGGYPSWDELASSLRSKANLEAKTVLVLHDSEQVEWERSTVKLQHALVEAVTKYHSMEGQRLKRKLKVDKTVKYPNPKMLATRIRFKVGWHFEAARDLKLAVHNYEKGYEEVRKLPLTLDTLIAADVIFFRTIQIQAVTLGTTKAAAAVHAHMAWCESYDPDTLSIVTPEGFVTTASASRVVARLIYSVHIAEAYRRYSALLLRVQPFRPEDVQLYIGSRHAPYNAALLEAGLMRGINAGSIQLLLNTALAFRRVRRMVKAAAAAQGGSAAVKQAADATAGALRPPTFLGREPWNVTPVSAAEYAKQVAHALPWRDASAAVFDAVSLAAPIAEQLGLHLMRAQFAALLAEHYEGIGEPNLAMQHNVTVFRVGARLPALANRHLDLKTLAAGTTGEELSAGEMVRFVKPTVAFSHVMYDAENPYGSGVLGANHQPVPVRLNAVFALADALIQAPLRFSKVEARVCRAELHGSGAIATPSTDFNTTVRSGTVASTATGQQQPATVALKPLPDHIFTIEDVLITPGQPFWAADVAPKVPITLAALYVIDKLTFTCRDGARVDVPVATSQQALTRLHAATAPRPDAALLLAASSAPGMPVPRNTPYTVSRLWFGPAHGLPVCRVWQPPAVVTARFVQPTHAIEGERHMLEVTLSVGATAAPVRGTLTVVSPDVEVIEASVGYDGEGWGPWMPRSPSEPQVTECPIASIEAGGSVTVPIVLRCHTAGQVTLPVFFSYEVEGLTVSAPMALLGTVALHVLHPVLAQITIHNTMASKALADGGHATSSLGDTSVSNTGLATKTAQPTDFRSARFVECAEMAEASGVLTHAGASALVHSYAGLLPDAAVAIRAPPPTLYNIAQHHRADNKGPARPHLSWHRPTIVSCRLTNNLQCRMAVQDMRLEAHEDSPLRVIAAPPVFAVDLDVDDEYSWIAAVAPAAGEKVRPLSVPSLGTLTVAMQRCDWGETEFVHRELAQVLLAGDIKYEIGLPQAVFDNVMLHASVDFPPVVACGQPFTVTLTLANSDPVRPFVLAVAVGEMGELAPSGGGSDPNRSSGALASSVNSMSFSAAPTPARTVEVTGKLQCTLSVPSESTRSVTWRAVATQTGHQALPVLYVHDPQSGQRFLGAQHQFSVFVAP